MTPGLPLGVTEIEDRFDTMSWTLAAYGNGGNHALMPYSRRHVIRPGTTYTLCGKLIGLHMGHGDSGRCKVCYRAASKAGSA